MSAAPDLFQSAAPYYAQFRPGYPEALFDHLAQSFGLGREHRVLDLGCGTGQLTLRLAARAGHVVALDPDPAMLEQAQFLMAEAGLRNITLLRARAEDLPGRAQGPFQLATLGRSFHWMERDAVLARLHGLVAPGGGIAIIFDDDLGGAANTHWKEVVQAVIRRHTGPRRRAGSGFFTPPAERHEDVLARGPFTLLPVWERQIRRSWTADQVIGWCLSTSYCSPAVLGGQRAAFEQDMKKSLLLTDNSGIFDEDVTVTAFLGQREK